MIHDILLWLQERIYDWTKPATPVDPSRPVSDTQRSYLELLFERELLRHQIRILERQVDKTRSSPKDGDSTNP